MGSANSKKRKKKKVDSGLRQSKIRIKDDKLNKFIKVNENEDEKIKVIDPLFYDN